MIRAGINMMLWTDFVGEEHQPILAALKAAGYDGVEIPLTQGDYPHYEKLRQILDQEGLACTTTCFGIPDKHLHSHDPQVRQAGIQRIQWAIDCNEILGSQVVAGPIHSAPAMFTGNYPTQEEMKWSAEGLNALGEYGKSKGVVVTIEYLNRFELYLTNTTAQCVELLKMADHENLGIHYDTHHAHIEERDIAEAIRIGGKYIKHVHYSESDRGVPGKGQVNWEATQATLKEIGYDGWVTVEAFNAKVDGLRRALHIWRDLYSSQEEVYLAGIDLIHKHWK